MTEVSIAAAGAIARLGDPTRVLGANPGDPYESELLEGAWMTEHDGMHYLMYSAGSWQDHYAVKVARSTSPLGPFERLDKPIMEAGGGFRAPGHHSMVRDGAGDDWMVYHAIVDGHQE